ncbi:MAG TPA: PspC domain-containing protein [Bacteroidota bacterium]
MTKRLYRSIKEKMIGGVCGGIAEYFDIDPVLIRILFVVAVFAGGSGILAYIICWIIIPEQPYVVPVSPSANSTQPASPQSQPVPEPGSHKGSAAAGVILIIIGGLFLADNFLPHFHFRDFWPLILVALGIGILSRSGKHS